MKTMALMLAVCFALGDCAVNSSFAQAREDKRPKQIESEKAKLSRTKDPVDRTESLMKIADITLTYVNDAIAANDRTRMESYVDEYRLSMKDARDTMMSSGLDGYKKPKGYQKIELATRAHIRILEDLARRLSLADRKSLEQAKQEVSGIRDEVLRALFP